MIGPRRTAAWVAAVVLVFQLLPPAAAARQAAVADAPRAGTTQGITEFDVNGLKVLVKQRAGSQTVAAGLFIRGGSRNITAENAGIESLMLDVATEASVNFPLERFRRERARTGTAIGSGTTRDYSAFTLGCTRLYFDSAWALFADAAMHPSFTESDFERVRNREITNLRSSNDTPDAYLSTLVDRVIYADHPYAHDPEGTIESLGRLTVADMRRYHEQVMQTSRLLLVIVGDLDPADIRQKVQASFGTLPRGNYTPSAPPPLSFAAPSVSVTSRDLPTNYIQGVYAAPPPTSPDIDPLRVATSILRDRVFDEVRLKRALSYAPSAFLSDQSANTGGLYVTAVDANESVRVMLGEVSRLQTSDVSAEEIEATAQQFLTNYYVGQQTNAAQAGALAQAEIVGNGWRSSLRFLDRINAVTPLDVRRVATRYMRHFQFVVLGPAKDLDRGIFLKEPDGVQSAPVQPGILLAPAMTAR